MKRLKVIVSAYACRPHMGSEPGVGWNSVQELSKFHDIWVLTRSDNRPSIEAALKKSPNPSLRFIYCDLPAAHLWKRGLMTVHLHYYLWQFFAYLEAKQLHHQERFQVAHHITYVRHSSPSFLALLPIPFIWGPVGGGESAPVAFYQDFSRRGQLYEYLRSLARWCGEQDPFVAMTARRSAIANATTADTAVRLEKLGAPRVQILSQVGMSPAEIQPLSSSDIRLQFPFRFVSIGRLLHWKGFHLSLKAFAQSDLPEDAEYWILGEGGERLRLEQLAQTLGISAQVKFLGELPRSAVLENLSKCHALVHPSLHESGGFVCLEAMAAGLPVLCLDLGGPAIQVSDETGIKVAANSPVQAVQDLADAMTFLAAHPSQARAMGDRGRQRVQDVFTWQAKGQQFSDLYHAAYEALT